MKAIWRTKYGSPDVLQLADVGRPTPNEDEVLIRVRAASVNAYDWHFLTADIFLIRLMGGGLLRPADARLGADMAGRVEAVGENVSQFKPGFEQAAALPMAAVTALQGLRDEGQIQAGQKVLINGASGGVGTFAVQIAKSFGAEVTAVCSTRNLDQARSIGADHVIDYTREDFTKGSRRYDLIFAANGYHPLRAYKRALTPQGIYVMAGGTMAQILQSMLLGSVVSETNGRQMRGVNATRSQDDLVAVGDLFDAGKVVPVIDRRYALDETAEALRYLGDGHARGKVVITMRNGDGP